MVSYPLADIIRIAFVCKGAHEVLLVRPILVMVLGLLLTTCSEPSPVAFIGATPTPATVGVPTVPTRIAGVLRTDPVPYGVLLSHKGMEITVLETIQWKSGELLYERVTKEGHISGVDTLRAPKAGEGFEWLIVSLRLRTIGDPNDTLAYTPTEFKVTGKSGSVYEFADLPPKKQRRRSPFADESERLIGRRYLDAGEFFGGSEITGDLIVRIAEQDDNFVLIYSPAPHGSRYLSLKPSQAGEGPRGTSVPTAVPTWPMPPLGTGKTNPVDFGIPFTHNNIEVTVLEVGRLAQEGRFFPGLSLRKSPDKGYHYIGVKLHLRNVGDRNDTRTYSKDHFWVTGKLGLVYSRIETLDTGELRFDPGEFFGGGEVTAAIAVEIPSDDDEFVLIYSPPHLGARYYSLSKP